MSLRIVLNGHPRLFASLASASTLQQLVAELGLQSDRVAAELNGGIVSRSSWSETSVQEGDRLEIVHFVGGG